MKFQLFLSISILGIIGALIWVSRPDGPAPTDDELKRELFVSVRPSPTAPAPAVDVNEGELARALRVVSAPSPAPLVANGGMSVFKDDSIPGMKLLSEIVDLPEEECARKLKQRLAELTPADALERTVLLEYVRDHVKTTEAARDIAAQELRVENARNLPADPTWQVNYYTTFLNVYLDAGKNDDTSLPAMVEAIAGQTNPEARLAMTQALLSRSHDGATSVQDALAARGVRLPESERNPSSAGPPARPPGAVEESF